MQSLKVAYLLLYFPHLTETFIAEEIEAIRSRNIDVRVISLLSPRLGPVQPLSQQLLQYTWYAPGVLSWALWRAQFHFMLRSFRLYLGLLAMLMYQPYPGEHLRSFLKRLVIFLKAVSVAHYLRGSGVELLHGHFAWLPGAATWICARLLGKPFTVTVHAYDLYSYNNDLARLVTQEASHVIAISEFNRSQVTALGTRPAEAISVIHCGVDLAKFNPQPARQTEPPVCSTLKILSVGSLVAKKGQRHLIAACSLLNKTKLDFVCTLIGSGPNERALREQIRDYGLERQVKLVGARSTPEIIEAYDQHDLFVLACTIAPNGDRDGIPVVLMEAGMAGLPLISTPVSGIPELVRHEQTGWLVPAGDAAALADAIAVLAANPRLRIRLGQNARALVEAEFSIERSTLQLAALFQNTCRQWKRTHT